MDAKQDPRLDKALDHMSVAPPEPAEDHPTTEVREAHDAEHHEELAKDPSHEESKLDVGLDESFPTSDPASSTQPGHADPAPSSGYDEEAEKALEREKADSR
ncbi:hypothetical protein [Sphingomonas chungangi]|nr:hypothetical protein [Sphingomonas chungangi]